MWEHFVQAGRRQLWILAAEGVMGGMSIIQTVSTVNGGWIATGEFLWVRHGQGPSVILSPLARVIWTTTIDVIGVFGVEGVFEPFGLIQIKLLFGLEGGSIQ